MSNSPDITAIPVAPGLARVLDAVRQAGLPALLEGSHGIGKSEFLSAYAQSRGMACTVLDLSLLEATDLTGIPFVREGRTHFAPPGILPTARGDGPCMLVLEELNRCDRSVRQPCLQLLTTRRLNDYRLPEGCFLTACVNPDDGTYEVDPLDPALASRFVRLRVEAEVKSWLAWARAHAVYPGVVRFVEKFPQAFDRAPPRTWTHAARLIESALGQGWSMDELELLLVPVLQPMTARALLMDLPHDLPSVTPTDLLAKASEYEQSFRTWMDKGRLDIIGVVLEGLGHHLRAHSDAASDPATDLTGVHTLLDIAPVDMALPILELLEAA